MKRITITSLFVACFSTMSLFAQIGVNTATPDPSSALDIRSPNPSDQRGVLLPRMSSSERKNINFPALPPKALMVYDTTDNLFYYFDGAKWNGLVPKQEQSVYPNNPSVKGNIVLDSGSVVATDITLSGNATVGGNLDVAGFSTNALVPTGTIIMWSGNQGDIPAGWGLCNGHYRSINNMDYGTTPPAFMDPYLIFAPDLRGRFIVGYDDRAGNPGNGYWDANYNNPHATGGEKDVTLLQGNLPPHQHTVNSGTDGGTVSISTSGNHNHSYPLKDDDNNNDDNSSIPETGNAGGSDETGATNSAGLHSHNIGGNTGDGTSLGLNSTPVNNLPPYYVIVYIIKLP